LGVKPGSPDIPGITRNADAAGPEDNAWVATGPWGAAR